MNDLSNALALAKALRTGNLPAKFSMSYYYNDDLGRAPTACIAGMAILMFGTEEERAELQLYSDILHGRVKRPDYTAWVLADTALRILGDKFRRSDFARFDIKTAEEAADFIGEVLSRDWNEQASQGKEATP